MDTRAIPKNFILIASDNIFSSSLIKVIETLTHKEVMFIPLSQANKEIKILEKPDSLIITIVLNSNEREEVDRLQSNTRHSLPHFLHCCIIKKAEFLWGEVLPIPINLQLLLKKLIDEDIPTVSNKSNESTIKHNREKLIGAISKFKHDCDNKIGPFKSTVKGKESKTTILRESFNSFFKPPYPRKGIAEKLRDDFNNFKAEISGFGLRLDDLEVGIEKKMEDALQYINTFPESFREGSSLEELIAQMDFLVKTIVGLREKLRDIEPIEGE